MKWFKGIHRMIGHYLFYIGFVFSCVGLIVSLVSHHRFITGIAGQPIENTVAYHWATVLVFAVMVMVFGYGVIACIHRDIRCRRMNELKKTEIKTANQASQPIAGKPGSG